MIAKLNENNYEKFKNISDEQGHKYETEQVMKQSTKSGKDLAKRLNLSASKVKLATSSATFE